MIEPKHALIITHGTPKLGCEQAAIEVQAQLIGHIEQLRAAGRIEGAHAYIALTGERMGLAAIEGDRDAIVELFWSKEWKSLMAQADSLTNRLQTAFGVGGAPASLAGPASVYAESISRLRR